MPEEIIKDKKYLNRVKVVAVDIIGYLEDGYVFEKEIVIKIEGKELRCFWCLWGNGSYLKDEEYTVQLTLMTFPGTERLNYKAKNIRTEKKGEAVPRCFLEGEIIAFYDIPNSSYILAIVDCGKVFVGVEVLSRDNFKIGDYIKAEGRLDICKIKDKRRLNNG